MHKTDFTSMNSTQLLLTISQFFSLLTTLVLFSRWFWLYTGVDKITQTTNIQNIDRQETQPLLEQSPNQLISFKNHARLLAYSFISSSILLLVYASQFIYDIIQYKNIDISQIALLFNCIMIMAISVFVNFEYSHLKSTLIIDHNRQDRLLSTFHFLTNYMSLIWIVLITVNLVNDGIILIYGNLGIFTQVLSLTFV